MKLKAKILTLVLVLATLVSMIGIFAIPASAATPEKLYLVPNSNWKVDNARFAAYFFGNGEKWVSMTYNSTLGVYEVTVPTGYPSVIFCRMNPSTTANNWNNKWNQTADLTVPTNGNAGNNCYTVKEDTWDKGGGTWGHKHYGSQVNGGTSSIHKKYDGCGCTISSTHSYTSSVTTAPTCSTTGVKTHKCSCGYSYTSTIEIDSDAHVVPEGTGCGADYVCEKCEGAFNNPHGNVVIDAEVGATCTEPGLTEGSHCSDCNTVIVAQEAIPAGHKEGSAATCTSDQICTVCEDVLVEAFGHNFVNGVCAGCNHMVVYFENNWKWSDGKIYYWGSAGTNPEWPGIALSQYPVVGKSSEDADIYEILLPADVDGFLFVGTGEYGEDKSADITDISACKCYRMSYDSATNTKPAVPYEYHVYGEWDNGSPASCTENGTLGHYQCSVCSKYFDAEKKELTSIVDPAGHKYGDWNKQEDASCTEDGTLGHYQCSECDKYFDAEKKELTSIVISAGHKYGDWNKQVDASCTEDGTLGHYQCSECKKYFDAEKKELTSIVISAGHKYGDWNKQEDASCTEDGTLGHYQCSECDKYFDAEKKELTSIVISAGHKYGAWNEQVDASCTENGTLGHYQCSECDKYFDAEKKELTSIVISAGHKYGDWNKQEDASCTEDGTLGHYQCSECKKYFDENKNELTSIVISAGH